MSKLEIVLVVAAIDLSDHKKVKFLLKNEADGELISLPRTLLSPDLTSLGAASKLLLDAAGVSNIWAKLHHVGIFDAINRVVDGDRVITIAYGTVIPDKVKLYSESYKWITLDEIKSHPSSVYMDHYKIISETGVRL